MFREWMADLNSIHIGHPGHVFEVTPGLQTPKIIVLVLWQKT